MSFLLFIRSIQSFDFTTEHPDFLFRPQTGKVANVILDGADEDDDADEFLVEEKPKDALELEIEPRPSSSTNLANVSYLIKFYTNIFHRKYGNLPKAFYNFTCMESTSSCIKSINFPKGFADRVNV